MKKEDLKRSGAISLGMGCVPIYFVESEGAFVFKNDVDGEWCYVGEVAAKTVLTPPENDQIEKLINKGAFGPNVIGVIYTSPCLIVIEDETTADNRPYYAMAVSTGKEYKIDLEASFDGIEDDGGEDDGVEIREM